MKKLMKILCTLAMMIPAIGSAQMTGAQMAASQDAQRQQPPVCTPYSVQAPCTPCANGYGNMMCKTTVSTCQNGVPVTATTPEFNTLACAIAPPNTYEASCLQQPESCAAKPRSGGCPTGMYWVNPPNQASPFYSSLIAVCVPSCAVGTVLSYTTSPPSCIGIVCPGNTVLYGNVCDCPASLPVRVGNTCSAPPPPPTPDCDSGLVNGSNVSCDIAGFPGYVGFARERNFTKYSGGGVCNSVFSNYSQGTCVPPALPACDSGIANGNPVTCDVAGYAGYVGTAYQTTFTTYSGGGACVATPTGGYAVGSCVPPPPTTCAGAPPASTVVTCSDQSLGLWTGSPYSTTPYVCSGTSWVPGSTVVVSSCSCANGNPAGISNCFACPSGTVGSFPSCACANGAADPLGSCQTCPIGSVMVNGMCKVPVAPPPAGPPCDPNNFPEFGAAQDRKYVVIPLQATTGSAMSGGEVYKNANASTNYLNSPPFSGSAIGPAYLQVMYLCINKVKRTIVWPGYPISVTNDGSFGGLWTYYDLGMVQGGYPNFFNVLDAFEANNPDAEKANRLCMQYGLQGSNNNGYLNPYYCPPLE